MELPEVRFYTPDKFETRHPKPKRRSFSCVQIDHRDGNGGLVRLEDIKDYDPCNRPTGDALIGRLKEGRAPSILEVYSQDCLKMAGTDAMLYGADHLTWRQLLKGHLQDFVAEFNSADRQFVVMPFLEKLRFSRDACLAQVAEIFPEFIEESEAPVFDFGGAVRSVLAKESVTYVDIPDRSILASKRGEIKGNNVLRIGDARQFSPCDPGETISWPKTV